MGCFTVLKIKKKRTEHAAYIKRDNPEEDRSTTLPEPKVQTRSLQSAPPSFRTRVKPIQPNNKVSNSRTRTLSAPSSFDSQQDALASVEYDEPEELKSSVSLTKEQWYPSPQPLPLPSPQGTTVLKNWGSMKSVNSSGPVCSSGPLPLPPHRSVRNFSYEEIVSACNYFAPNQCMSEGLSSTIYKASFGDDASGSRKLEATVTCFHFPSQGLKDFVNEVSILASLQHPCLCKLMGFSAREGSEQKMLVYERLYYGSLDRLLYGRSDSPPIDWNGRMKVALCAAQGLTFLHEEGPFQAMYNEFSTANVQIDKDLSAKLSGYGCVSYTPETEFSNSSIAVTNISGETLERGLLTPKSNVWSYGIILLELLTGRKNLDGHRPKEERDLVKWSRPFLADDCRLSLIMDPQLKGRFPQKAARIVADIALRCLLKDPSERPTMRFVSEHLKTIQDMKYSVRYPLQEPATIAGKQMSKSSSLNRIGTSPKPIPGLSLSPPVSSGTSFCLQESRISSSSSPYTGRRASVEGF